MMINLSFSLLLFPLKLMVLLSVLCVKLFVILKLSLLNILRILLCIIVLILMTKLVTSSKLMSLPCSFAAPQT